MEVMNARCCGLDVHKSSITACILIAEGKARKRVQRQFGTVTAEIVELAKWLNEFGVMQVAMESTGVYWAAGTDEFNFGCVSKSFETGIVFP